MTPDKMRIPFNEPFIVGKELYYIAEAVLKNRHLSGDGPFSRKCEKWLETALGCRKALLTHSGTAALEMAAILCDVGPGDEVIMPSFTFVSTANAFVLRGAVPVFIDIKPENLNINHELITAAMTPRTRGIVPVHYAGIPCAMDDILQAAAKEGLWVVEDAAHALLSDSGGRYLGTMGDLGCLSFHETKNIISGEGGALLVNSERFLERADIVREKGTNRKRFLRGQVDKYTWVDIGSSFLPSDMIAAFLFAQLEVVETITAARRRLVCGYNEQLFPLHEEGLVRLPLLELSEDCNGHIYYIITRSPDERTALIRHMARRGIGAVFHYVPLHSSPAGRKYGRVSGTMEVTDTLSQRVLRLPLYFGMTGEDQLDVVATMREFYYGEE
jgi:dTDP-4-amino-4,6-dideoxygalactose transaminase